MKRSMPLIGRIKDLNKDITADESLGKAFCIGHSYFCDRKPEECTEEWMADVVDYEILRFAERILVR